MRARHYKLQQASTSIAPNGVHIYSLMPGGSFDVGDTIFKDAEFHLQLLKLLQ